MVQSGGEHGLAKQSIERFFLPVFAEYEKPPKYFQRNIALQPRIPGAIHLAHAAGAKMRNNFIGTDLGSGGETHGREA
jgi:hypothetical protein